jgi:DHA1 family bicyclomycin/chloramphenicol resistance-like MFS transporter
MIQFRVAALLTALVAFGPISTDLYLASLPDMARHFGTGVPTVQLTLSVFLAAFAVAMPVYGPLSDRFGRRPVILGGTALYLAATLFCVAAPSIEALIAGRALQAMGACCGPVVGRAVVRDLYPRDQAARVLSYMASAMAMAPFAAPIAGGWFHSWFGWRANFCLLAVFGAALLIAAWRILDETNRHRDVRALDPLVMLSNYRALLGDRTVLAYVLTVALSFGGMFTFISASSFVLIDVLGLPVAHFGFGFAVVIAGYIAGGLVAGRLTARVGLDRMIRAGCIGAAVAGTVMAGLAWAGVATIAAVVLPMSGYFFCAALVLPNSTAGAIAPHPRMAGTASALVGFAQMVGGALAGWLAAALFDGTTRPLGTLVMALGAATLAVFLAVRRG